MIILPEARVSCQVDLKSTTCPSSIAVSSFPPPFSHSKVSRCLVPFSRFPLLFLRHLPPLRRAESPRFTPHKPPTRSRRLDPSFLPDHDPFCPLSPAASPSSCFAFTLHRRFSSKPRRASFTRGWFVTLGRRGPGTRR